MTLLYFFKSRAYVGFDKADLYRKKRKYQQYEEQVAAELLKEMLSGEDVIIPEKSMNLRSAVENKLITTIDKTEKQKLKLMLIMLAMED